MNSTEPSLIFDENVTDVAPIAGGSDWYKVAADTFMVVDPIITFGGIIGNILAFMVMRRQALRSSSVSLFLASLAVVDSLVLALDFINNYFKYYLDIYLLKYKGFCEFHRTIFNVAYTYATWLVVAVTVERFIVVWTPLRAKQWCTKRNAKIAIIVMPVVLTVIYFYNFFGYRVDEEGKCDVHPRMEFMMNFVSPWLTAVLYSYAPVIVLFCCNIAIGVRLIVSKRNRESMAANTKKAQSNDTMWLTIMVIVVSVVFMILTIPATLWYVLLFAKGEFQSLGAKSAFVEIIVLILALFNHSINFFLYTISSQNFRKELKAMFGLKKEWNRGSSATDSNSTSKRNKYTGRTASSNVSISSTGKESNNGALKNHPDEKIKEDSLPDV